MRKYMVRTSIIIMTRLNGMMSGNDLELEKGISPANKTKGKRKEERSVRRKSRKERLW